MDRKRKTKDPCAVCGLHKNLCICDLIPNLKLATKLSLVVHAKELKRTTNTGRLAIRALTNSKMYVRGKERETLDLSHFLNDDYQPLFFYPTENAEELTKDFLSQFSKPIHLIVPDGNWRQASKVHIRHKELSHIPRVKISSQNTSTAHLRAEHMTEGMATLEAIAHAMKVIEGEDTFQSLIGVYNAKLDRTLQGRGIQISPR